MAQTTNTKINGFTIVELLIVIVVIAILAAISIVAFRGIQDRAKVSKANSDLATLTKAISIGRINTNKTLRDITGSDCTACNGTTGYNTALTNIAQASGTNLNQLRSGDPWGNLYQLDENEGENPGTPCVNDLLYVTNFWLHPGVKDDLNVPTFNC